MILPPSKPQPTNCGRFFQFYDSGLGVKVTATANEQLRMLRSMMEQAGMKLDTKDGSDVFRK